MKQIFRIIFNITLLAVLAGCNDVVFLEPLNPSVEQVSFSEAGGEAEVEMNHGDFIIEKITLDGEDVRGLMTMEDGRQSTVPFVWTGLGLHFTALDCLNSN